MSIIVSQSKQFKDLFTYQATVNDAWFDKDGYKLAITTAVKAKIFEGSGGFCKLEHKVLTVLRHKVPCKHCSVIFFK